MKVALLLAHYWPYAVMSFGVIVLRAGCKKLRLKEVLLILLFALLVGLEIVQLRVSTSKLDDVFIAGRMRYFGALSPLLWIFAAKGLAYVWGLRNGLLRWVGRVIIGLGLGYLLLVENVLTMVRCRTDGTAYDTAVAVEQVVPIIKRDYLGPERQAEIKPSLAEYYTGKRPLISSPYAAAGWALRGDACGATGAKCPYREDYLFLPIGGNYNNIKEVDPNEFLFIAHVRGGLGTIWALFRRRTTPSR